MLEDFKRALARVQSDYGFYIDCQTQPAVALEGYALTPEERSALSNPRKLSDMFRRGIDVTRLKITISGTHDWINAADGGDGEPDETVSRMAADERDARVEAVKRAKTDEERAQAAFRLIELLG
jgi:hypothetical protein